MLCIRSNPTHGMHSMCTLWMQLLALWRVGALPGYRGPSVLGRAVRTDSQINDPTMWSAKLDHSSAATAVGSK